MVLVPYEVALILRDVGDDRVLPPVKDWPDDRKANLEFAEWMADQESAP
jgi:hypothetical protein